MSKSTSSLSWSEFLRLAKAGMLSSDQVAGSVVIDDEHTTAFAPVLRFMSQERDDEEAPIDSDRIENALQINNDVRRLLEDRVFKGTSNYTLISKLRIAVEGDSWFNLPDVVYPDDLVDILENKYDVRRAAIWKDTLENIVHGRIKQYMQILKSGNFKHFLLSGGGNDILGSVHSYVYQRESEGTDPDKPHTYIRPEFYDRVAYLISLFDEIADDVSRVHGVRIIMYVHGYANAIPVPNGDYLGNRFKALGFDPVTHGPQAAAVVAALVAVFNRKLEAFAASRANVVYVDLRPHMGRDDWNWDEIHPNGKAAERLAAVFSKAIQSHEPSLTS